MSVAFWIGLILTVGALLIATELGYLFGCRQTRHGAESVEAAKSTVGIAVAALLALLGLLLGFTFSMVDQRYGARKSLVIEDANAIGTAYLRAGLLSQQHADHAQALLREYVELRTTRHTEDSFGPALQRTREIQDALWEDARKAARYDSHSQVAALFIASINSLIDAHAARVNVSLHQRLPAIIRFVLYLAACLGLAVVGFNAGLSRRRSLFATTALIIAVATVMTAIVELNRPRHPLGHLDLAMFDELRQQMATEFRPDRAMLDVERAHPR